MSVINAVALLAAAGGDYQISRSVRLRSSASAYFNRTPASASDQKKWTFSAWVKRGQLGATQIIAQAGTSGTTFTYIAYFNSSDQLVVLDSTVSGVSSARTTAAVFRDPSAWYHVVVYLDAANATSKVYVNNVEQTCTGTQPSNQNWAVNSAIEHRIGRAWSTNTSYLDGYLTEINFIDGQALTPSSFGETDAVTGVWKPKRYTGTYGTNGFYLNFSDNSNNTAATIGKDYSGNGNNWTPNNISVTSGVTYDSMLDVPTPYADGGNGRGNYAVLNPLDKSNGGNTPTMSNGNLSAAAPANPTHIWSSIALPVGSTDGWYWEGICTSMDAVRTYLGIIDPTTTSGSIGAPYAFVDKCILANTGTYYNTASGTGGTGGTSFTSYAANDVVMVAYKNGKIWFGKNGTWMNSGDPAAGTGAVDSSVSTTKQWIPYFGYNSSWTANFGQRPFAYTPPTGFVALNTQNLPDSTIKKGNQYFDATTYTGNSSTQSIVNSGSMQPDLVWLKSRSGALASYINDSVRGAYKTLFSSLTNAEYDGTSFSDGVSAFNSNGFTLLNGSNVGNYNQSGSTYVGWQWKESASAGFDIVTFTNPASGSASFAHSLGVKPSMIITKARSGTGNWAVTHKSLGANMQDYYLLLNGTAASTTSAGIWGGEPTSSVFYSSASLQVPSATMVAYLFAEVAGFSKFGSYTGNGSTDGPFVYTGFRPRFVMWKRTDSTAGWAMMDSSRSTFNLVDLYLVPNSSQAETSGYEKVDFLSNGFKLRETDISANASGGTYIYAAFAENPFKNSLAR